MLGIVSDLGETVLYDLLLVISMASVMGSKCGIEEAKEVDGGDE